ncbi:hypothetical protein A9995_11760 [Erythrobacter sp. QSSC1-22B]|uniref:hypothetical protein n=1 Tax=Erythrobacter sp. QSSC1-22B TaxID=1860125 RepID=UPI000804B68B|nr:hypothetical protein [Erythrobacter sp. QSSC1-22B]OBX18624.1 hypothetical protein A9995_11760 [Erythrobacter sp. QSSC1-22B]
MPHLPLLAGSPEVTDVHLPPAKEWHGFDAGAWAWEPAAWQEGCDALIRDAVTRKLNHLYITLTIADRCVRHEAELSRFVRAAAQAKIAVEAVEGDPRMVLTNGLSKALDRARAIARYRANAPADAQLAEIQYDIEPYVLQGWGKPPVDYRAWSAAVNALARAVGAQVHLVLPFWVADEACGVRFLRDVEPSVKAVTIMGYRTEAALVADLARPLLHWGVEASKPVRIALEAGPVAGETPPDRISFLGNEQRMFDAAIEVAQAVSSWDSFAGISFHGLSWSLR